MKTNAPFPPTNSNTAKLIKGGKMYFDVLKELILPEKVFGLMRHIRQSLIPMEKYLK